MMEKAMADLLSCLEKMVLQDVWNFAVNNNNKDGNFRKEWTTYDSVNLLIKDATMYLDQVDNYWKEKLS